MIITTPFDGLYYGKDPEAEAKQYVEQLREYSLGNYGRMTPYPTQTERLERVTVPDKDYFLPQRKSSIASHHKTGGCIDDLPAIKQKAIKDFWKTEGERWVSGTSFCVGTQYAYWTWVQLRHTGTGRGPVIFRQHDNVKFALMESCLWGENIFFPDNRGAGIVDLGSRQIGKSCMGGFFAITILTFMSGVDVGLSSKKKDDTFQVLYLKKIRPILDGLPFWLWPDVVLDTKTKFEVKNFHGGINTFVFGGANPHDMEGNTLTYLFADEGPKTKNFDKFVEQALPMLESADGESRGGLFHTSGVAGDFGVHGRGFIDIWEIAPSLNLIRWFSPGWVKLFVDEFGNNDIYRGALFILNERNKVWKENTSEEKKIEAIEGLMQKRPLTVQEAFLEKSAVLFPTDIIRSQKKFVSDNQAKIQRHIRRGRFEWVIKGESVKFVPTAKGPVEILELPKRDFLYAPGVDAYGRRQRVTRAKRGSDGCLVVHKLPNPNIDSTQVDDLENQLINGTVTERIEAALTLGNLPVCWCLYGPPNPADFAEIVWQACIFYSPSPYTPGNLYNVQALLETSPDTIWQAMLERCPELVAPTPVKHGQKLTPELLRSTGVKPDVYWSDDRLTTLYEYIELHGFKVFWLILLEHFLTYNPDRTLGKKWDTVDATYISQLRAKDFRLTNLNVNRIRRKVKALQNPFPGFR